MAAISTPKINSVYKRILADFPDITFAEGAAFQWSAAARTITHPPLTSQQDIAHLLHEIGHARLNHRDYTRDIQLIRMEREAWEYAIKVLAPRYHPSLTPEDTIVQSSLDTYRQWLHDRSICLRCDAVGLEQDAGTYLCISCHQHWRPNEARTCNLRRYTQ